jgi:hypothetical protein
LALIERQMAHNHAVQRHADRPEVVRLPVEVAMTS